MDNLKRLIGLAPSEMPRGELLTLVRIEHERTSRGLSMSFTGKKGSAKKKKLASRTTIASSLERKFGISLDEMELRLAKLKALEEKGE